MSRLLALALVFALAMPAVAADKEKEKDPARQKAAEKRFAKLKEYLKERRVTHVVELLAEWGEFADANQQDDVLGWVADLRAKEDELGQFVAYSLGTRKFEIGYRGVKATADLGKKEIPASAYFVDDYHRSLPPRTLPYNEGVFKQLVVASKTLVARPNLEARGCVLLTNAAVAEFRGLDGCVVISSGSVSVTQGISTSAVVCRGDVEYVFDPNPYQGRVWAGGAIADVNPIVKGRKKPEAVWATEKQDKLLGIKFYSCTEDGLAATADAKTKAVTVSKLDAKKPFATAGVKEGDVIVTVNGEKVPTLHELDRLLCRATVASGVAKLTVKRGDKSEVIEVKLADW